MRLLVAPTTPRAVGRLLLLMGASAYATSPAEIKERLLRQFGDRMTRPALAQPDAGAEASCEERGARVDKVEVQLHVDRYASLEQTKETFGFDGYLRVWWQDERLSYNESECDGRLLFSPDEIRRVWTPDLYWEDAANSKVTLPGLDGSGAGETFAVYPDGRVWWSRQAGFELACPMDLSMMPFDVQRCAFLMGVYTYRSSEVSLQWRADTSVEDSTTVFGGGPAGWERPRIGSQTLQLLYRQTNYSYAQAHFEFARQPELYMWSYFFPSLMAVFMASLGFLVKFDAVPARAALGIISMLIGLTNLVALNRSLPPGGGAHSASDSLPWLMSFMLGSFVWTGVAMVILVLASFGHEVLHWLERQQAKLDSRRTWQQALLANPSALIELLDEWDDDHSGNVNKREFRRGVSALGLIAKAVEVNDLFDTLDRDGDGVIEMDELKAHFTAANYLAGIGMEGGGVASTCGGFASAGSHGAKAASDNVDSNADTEEAAAVFAVAAEEVAVSLEAGNTGGAEKRRVRTGACGDGDGGSGRHSSFEGTRVKQLSREIQRRRQTSRMRLAFRKEARDDLGKGWMWSCRTFKLGPCLARLRFLDVPARFVFPLGYAIYVFWKLSEVQAARELLLARSRLVESGP